MSNADCTLTHADVCRLLSYDAQSGVFTWRQAKVSKRQIAGCLCAQGYWRIKIAGKSYKAHRLAWFVTFGVWPADMIDHINGDRSDNRLNNLRLADNAKNQMNRRNASSRNKSAGMLGVNWNPEAMRYAARLQFGGKRIHIGYFDSPEEASQAYNAKKAALTEFAPTLA